MAVRGDTTSRNSNKKRVLTGAVLLIAFATTAASGCSGQSRPPDLQAEEVRGITISLDIQIGPTYPGMVYVEQQDKIGEFVRTWRSLETVRPPNRPESPEAYLTILVFLKDGGTWKLRWNPGNGEGSFWLTGEKTAATLPRSPMKVQSPEMHELAQGWLTR